jgi:hypothetical protein
MEYMLYAIYGGFLLGTFSLGIIVAGITSQSTNISTSNSSTIMPSSDSKALESKTVTEVLSDYLRGTLGILILSFILSGAGMIAIGAICLRSRNNRVNKIDAIIERNITAARKAALDENQKMAVEKEILDLFPPKT